MAENTNTIDENSVENKDIISWIIRATDTGSEIAIKKLARTIADLEAHEQIEKEDLMESLSYRRR